MKLLRLLLVGWGLIAVCLAEAKDVLDVLVVDPDGRPVSNVVVTVRTMNKLPLFGVERDADSTEYQATTDGNGRAEVRFRCLAGCFDWWVEGDGYYASDLHYEEFASEEPSSPLPIGFLLRQYRKQVRITLLPEINPRPMCKSDWHNKHKFPESQSACGFDLEKGDFVRPHGCGEVADFLLTRNTRMGKNVWGGRPRRILRGDEV